MRFRTFILTFLLTSIYSWVQAQNSFEQIESTDLYSSKYELINGEAWTYTKKYDGHPFWKTNNWLKGSIKYKDRYYEDETVKYDVHLNELIVLRHLNDGSVTFKLNKKNLQEFTLVDPQTNETVRFTFDQIPDLNEKLLYALQYDGKSKLYIVYGKEINNVVSDNYTGEYIANSRVFVQLSGKQTTEVFSRKDFLDLFAPNEKEIKKYMRKNRIRFHKKTPENLIPVFSYFDSLAPQNLKSNE